MNESPRDHDSLPRSSSAGCLVRLGWMVAANLMLVAGCLIIARKESLYLSVADALVWLAVLAAVALRWLDIHKLGGLTAAGQRPARDADWRRYALAMTGFGLAAWGLSYAWVWAT
ncbi:MAG: hypothetical protein BIFFINMI_01871 [Phycisphaerae bacterium]|nr:hypothetical protein [Phycisphaerae bacterium]